MRAAAFLLAAGMGTQAAIGLPPTEQTEPNQNQPNQSEPSQPDSGDPTQSDTAMSSPLAGPSVKIESGTTAIGEASFQSGHTLPDSSPEEAALALLNLTDEERADVQRVLARRAAFLDEFIVDNIPLLTKLGVAAGTNDRLDQLGLAREAYEALRPMFRKGPLQRQVVEALPPAKRAEYDRILKDFWNTVVQARSGIRKPDGTLPNRFEIVTAVRFEMLGKEVERAFQRLLTSGDLFYKILVKGIPLRENQSAVIVPMIQRHARRGDALTDLDNLRLFLAVMALLDTDQQRLLMANLAEITGKKRPENTKPSIYAKPSAKAPRNATTR